MRIDFPKPTQDAVAVWEARRSAIAELAARPRVDADDVVALRRLLMAEGMVSRDEAEALFAIERRNLPCCPEWRDFFVEAIVDYLLWQTRPSAVLNEEKAEWLIGQADRSRTFAAFAVLVVVLDEAQRVPRWFAPAVRGRARKGWPGLAEAAAA